MVHEVVSAPFIDYLSDLFHVLLYGLHRSPNPQFLKRNIMRVRALSLQARHP